MGFEKEELDLVLVPAGLLFMFTYHLFFLFRYLHRPHTTFMGYENNDKRAWVKSIMENKEKSVSAALTVTSSNTTAATYLATISLTLCSLIGAWIANSSNIFRSEIIYGDTRASTISIKELDRWSKRQVNGNSKGAPRSEAPNRGIFLHQNSSDQSLILAVTSFIPPCNLKISCLI
ncbi:uncharacterized protein LOC121266423 isoform X2 [Juglans microcarpa x Juglans regia]|uniref:uncharacterized protein LOC121266423 isoform X2 n=1 Tax=Juglans microcarpa x Juglans regia TaxID=2249226 RepID=UPI001B7E1557|nr:uncharacterized protein LOC121266423 isoform X2 [Juglans microcarpa x Juglans regia]